MSVFLLVCLRCVARLLDCLFCGVRLTAESKSLVLLGYGDRLGELSQTAAQLHMPFDEENSSPLRISSESVFSASMMCASEGLLTLFTVSLTKVTCGQLK